jgi:hypothetical protein
MHQLLLAELVAVHRSDFERAAGQSRLVKRARASRTESSDTEPCITERNHHHDHIDHDC